MKNPSGRTCHVFLGPGWEVQCCPRDFSFVRHRRRWRRQGCDTLIPPTSNAQLPETIRYVANATNGSTAIAQLNGPVTLYATCSARVSSKVPEIKLDAACDPGVRKLLEAELKRIATLEKEPAAKLDEGEMVRLLSLVRSQYRSARMAAIEREAARKTLGIAMRNLQRQKTLMSADLTTQRMIDVSYEEVKIAQAHFRLKQAAYQFALTNNAGDELEVFKADAEGAHFLLARSSAALADIQERIARGQESPVMLDGARLEQMHDQERLATACAALADQVDYVSAIKSSSAAASFPSTDWWAEQGCRSDFSSPPSIPGSAASASEP